MNQTATSRLFTNVIERLFNSGAFIKGSPSLPFDKRFSSTPLDKDVVKPFDTGPFDPAPPFYWRPTTPPFYWRPTTPPFYWRPTVTPIYKGPTVKPSTWRPTFPKWPTTRQRWDLKPPDKEVRPTHVTVSSATGWGHSPLENVIWVALGGFVVMVLLAIFMKLGSSIRRVRRHLSHARPAPNVITRRQGPDDPNLDMGSLLRLSDTAASTDAGPLHDLPPPYSECVCTNKHDTEEPPPSFSACFVTYTNTKDTEPKVHIQRQNVLFEDESFTMNDSEDVDGMRTELVLVNGRIVERPKVDLSSHSNETGVASNGKVKISKHAHYTGRVVCNDATHVKVNI